MRCTDGPGSTCCAAGCSGMLDARMRESHTPGSSTQNFHEPIFATAFATHNTGTTFLVGLAASLGAGISMGFTEAASDDGEISGRGSPLKRGIASGVMTALGGLGHALPYLIPHFWTATAIAFAIVFFELWAIAWIQNKYMETPFWRASFQVVLGGALVFATGILIGSA